MDTRRQDIENVYRAGWYIDWQTIGIGSDHFCDNLTLVTLSPALLITATYSLPIS